METDGHQSNFVANQIDQTEHSTVAVQDGRKRKITDDNDDIDDDSTSTGQNGTAAVKRPRVSDNDFVASTEANQENVDDCITDDNGRGQNERETRENGKRSIHSDEAFRQGYVVVIPSTYGPFWFPCDIFSFKFIFVYDFCSENG